MNTSKLSLLNPAIRALYGHNSLDSEVKDRNMAFRQGIGCDHLPHSCHLGVTTYFGDRHETRKNYELSMYY